MSNGVLFVFITGAVILVVATIVLVLQKTQRQRGLKAVQRHKEAQEKLIEKYSNVPPGTVVPSNLPGQPQIACRVTCPVCESKIPIPVHISMIDKIVCSMCNTDFRVNRMEHALHKYSSDDVYDFKVKCIICEKEAKWHGGDHIEGPDLEMVKCKR